MLQMYWYCHYLGLLKAAMLLQYHGYSFPVISGTHILTATPSPLASNTLPVLFFSVLGALGEGGVSSTDQLGPGTPQSLLTFMSNCSFLLWSQSAVKRSFFDGRGAARATLTCGYKVSIWKAVRNYVDLVKKQMQVLL